MMNSFVVGAPATTGVVFHLEDGRFWFMQDVINLKPLSFLGNELLQLQ
jgi:hypothetical protein